MQVVERFVGNDARCHVHDVALGDGLGFAVGVERLPKQLTVAGEGVAVNATNN